ncbi:hypothetical protein OSTOST_24962, partial [Ostertagia ostertagi]
MSASAYIKGQMTKAANAFKEKVKAAERILVEVREMEMEPKEDKRSTWQRGENHVDEMEDEKKHYDVLQDFLNHWEANQAEQLLVEAQVLVSKLEAFRQQDKDKQNNTQILQLDNSIQLPRLEIPFFDGDMVEFPEFWELFSIAVHNNPALVPSSKFVHLKSKLRGKAKDLIVSVQLSAENYPRAETEVLAAASAPGVEKKSKGAGSVRRDGYIGVYNVDPGEWAPTTMAPTQPTQAGLEITWETAITAGKNIKKDREEKEEAIKRREEKMQAHHVLLLIGCRHVLGGVYGQERQAERFGRKSGTATKSQSCAYYTTTLSRILSKSLQLVSSERSFDILLQTMSSGTESGILQYQIEKLLQLTLLEIVQHTTQSFHNLAVILVRRQPLEIRYTHLMGWIHELTHSTTAMTVNRDQLQDGRMTKTTSEQPYKLFGITEDTLREILMHSSAVHAHATRMIRVLEAHQMVHFFNRRRVRVTSEDEEYRLSSAVSMPPPWPEEPESYIQSLRPRKNISRYRGSIEYFQEQAQGLQQRPTPQVPQRPLTQITVPKLPPPTAWPTSDPLVPPEAGHPSTSAAGRREESQALGKRKHGDDSSSSRNEATAVSQAPSAPSRSRSRFPTRAAPSESHGKVEPCAFCHGTGHYSSDCDKYPY